MRFNVILKYTSFDCGRGKTKIDFNWKFVFRSGNFDQRKMEHTITLRYFDCFTAKP